MQRGDAILALLVIAGGVLLLSQTSAAAYLTDGNGNIVTDSNGNPVTTGTDTGVSAMPDFTLQDKANALLNVIGQFESENDYSKLFGGGHFYDYSTHPNIRVPFRNPKTGKMDYSTAAGKYQINYPTFLDLSRTTGLTDFSPETQDLLAYELLGEIGALQALNNNDYQGAIIAAGKKWASLPGSTSMQHQQSMQVALNAFNNYLQG